MARHIYSRLDNLAREHLLEGHGRLPRQGGVIQLLGRRLDPFSWAYYDRSSCICSVFLDQPGPPARHCLRRPSGIACEALLGPWLSALLRERDVDLLHLSRNLALIKVHYTCRT